jgi:hypothetical protein
MSATETGVGARIYQALAFFGAGLNVSQVMRPSEPGSAVQQPTDGATETR